MDNDSFFWQIQAGRLPVPPAARTLGMRILAVDTAAASIDVEFQAQQAFLNPAGQIQGGFLAAMLDDCMGPALAAGLAAGEFAPTLQLNVQFLRPAHIGRIQGRGQVVRRGRDVCHLAGELRQDDQLIATATATALIRQAPRG
ncbi:MAG: PaaI family thioesterase [Pseudomonas sp.]|uniref:PaaI family thioesterase n=1 Tax=Pseudomonas sp. TaxID=306 RepID=UPI00339AF0BD